MNLIKTLDLLDFLNKDIYSLKIYYYNIYPWYILCGKKNLLESNIKTHQQRGVFGYNIDIYYK